MRSPVRVLLALAVAVVATLVATGAGSSAQAATGKGLANGTITCPHLARCPSIKVQWFDRSWNYLGAKNANGGGYSLTLSPGTYHLQFVDKRPAYDTSKFAPTDVKVTVHANDLAKKNVTMRRGASITGTATGGNRKPLRNAHVVAARTDGVSFATDANSKGQFAVGGLPEGKYSIFTFDRSKAWVGKSAWANRLRPGQSKNFAIRLPTRAGNLTVYLFQPDGLLKKRTTLTVTSNKTGQWWSATSGNGTFVLRGLYPGGYRVQFDGAGVWFAKSGTVQKASVKPGKMDFGSFHVTKRGGWITGSVLDGGGSSGSTNFAMPTVRVGLYDPAGHELATDVTDSSGNFKLTGQLATQDGLSITVDPNPNGGGWMQASPPDNWCLFKSGEMGGLGVTQGEETFVDTVFLPRSTASGQASECLS